MSWKSLMGSFLVIITGAQALSKILGSVTSLLPICNLHGVN